MFEDGRSFVWFGGRLGGGVDNEDEHCGLSGRLIQTGTRKLYFVRLSKSGLMKQATCYCLFGSAIMYLVGTLSLLLCY